MGYSECPLPIRANSSTSNGWPIGSPLDRWPGLPCTAPVADDSWRTRPVSTHATGSRQLSSSRSSPLMVLQTGGRVCFTQSCQRPFYLRQLLPPWERVRPRTQLSAILELLSVEHPRFAVRYPERISVRHLFEPGGAPMRLRYPPILTGRCAMRLRYPLIYNRTGGTFFRQ